MTRKKKTRKINTFSPQLEARKSRTSSSKKKKGKGLSSGNKNNPTVAQSLKFTANTSDKGINNKKQIPLIRPHRLHQSSAMAPYDELIALENDPRLHLLLDRKENNQALSTEDADWLQEQLDRIEVLLNTCDGDDPDNQS